MSAIDLFESHRPMLFGVAYRMLGSASEADDAVQDTWLRWRNASVEAVRSPRSWLVTVITRLCLDQLRSARVRREQYVGPWLPEPIVAAISHEPGPEASADAVETIDYAFMVMLERLGPVERAVFILHDVFEFGYDEVAAVVKKSEAACRQTLHRARERLREPRKRFTATREERQRLTQLFVQAAGRGDIDALVSALAEDVVLYSDGGGKRYAALNPIYGRDKVVRFAVKLSEKLQGTLHVEPRDINGVPGWLLYESGELTTVFILGIGDGQVREVWAMRNPDKLTNLAAPRRIA